MAASRRGSGFGRIAALPGQKTGEAVTVAVRPENVRPGVNGASENAFTARVTDTRYQGTQTVYELLGGRIDALERGTSCAIRSARRQGSCCRRTRSGPIRRRDGRQRLAPSPAPSRHRRLDVLGRTPA